MSGSLWACSCGLGTPCRTAWGSAHRSSASKWRSRPAWATGGVWRCSSCTRWTTSGSGKRPEGWVFGARGYLLFRRMEGEGSGLFLERARKYEGISNPCLRGRDEPAMNHPCMADSCSPRFPQSLGQGRGIRDLVRVSPTLPIKRRVSAGLGRRIRWAWGSASECGSGRGSGWQYRSAWESVSWCLRTKPSGNRVRGPLRWR